MFLDNLFEFPVTKPVPYGRWFHVCFAIFQFVALSIFIVWAAATAGYETITIASPNYNMTQKLWYSNFVPDGLEKQFDKEGLCSGATSFTPGASFTTTNDLFAYEIESYYAMPGENTRPSDVVEYRAQTLDSCAPANVLLTIDTIRNTVDGVVLVYCYDAWPVVASNHYTFSTSPVKSLLIPGARGSSANSIWTNVNSTSTYIFRALDYLSQDLLSTAKLAVQQSNGAAPTEYSLNLNARLICPISYIGRPSCPSSVADWKPDFHADQAVNSYPNGSQTVFGPFDAINQNQDLAIPSKNLATALHAATVYDLGYTTQVRNNIYTTLSSMTAQIQPINTNATTTGVRGSTLPGAVAMLADTSFPVPATGRTVVRATYLCRIKVLKNAAGFVIAVVGLAMSLFTSLVGIATIAIVFLLRYHRPNLMHCEGHTEECHQTVPVPMVYDQKGTLIPAYSPSLPSPPIGQTQPMMYNSGQAYQPVNQGPASTAWPNQPHQGPY